MAANLQGLELTDANSVLYNFEPYKEDNKQRNITVQSRDWELGDSVALWKVPLFPFDGGLRQDRLPTSADLTREFNRARSYAKGNIDASNAGVLVPPPALNNISLTNTVTPTKQKSFDSKQFFLCGRYIYTVARDGTLALDKDFGSGKEALDFEIFNNELIVAMGETEKIWKRAVGGAWTQATNDTFAIALGLVGNKLWRAESVNKLSACTTTPLTLTNWTPTSPNQYTVRDTSYSITGIVEYGGVPVILRPDGVFMPDSKSDFFNQAPQIANWPHDDNGKGTFTAQGYLWVPTVIGLLRITIGESLIFGPEKSNRPDFRFWVRGGVEWGEAIYLLVTDEINIGETFICKMVKDEHGITDNHVYVYHEWTRLGSNDKGYSLGINTWPNSGPIAVTRDAGTVANVAGAGVDWSNPSNAISDNNSYATSTQGTTDPLRFSNFGFSIPTDATLLGYIATLERKTSAGDTTVAAFADNAEDILGTGTKVWTIDFDGTTPSFATFNSGGVNGSTHYLRLTDFDFAIPSDATIVGVKVKIEATLNGSGVIDNIVRLSVDGTVSGNNKASPSGWSTGTVIYGGVTDTWGLTLTPAQVNDPTFGFVFAVAYAAGGSLIVNLDPVTTDTSIEITYSVDGTVDSVVKIVDASGTAVGDNKAVTTTDWPSSNSFIQVVQYGADDDLWGTSLTPTDVNDADFGFSISVVNPTGITASVDYGYMTVVYQPAEIITNPTLFIGHGTNIKYIQLGFGSGRDIDDPNYPFGTSCEIETGLIQPTQDVTLISGIIGCSLVGKIRATDEVTIQYALGADATYTDLLDTQEGGGTALITGDGSFNQFTRLAEPNTIAPYFKFKFSATVGEGSGTDRLEIRNWWAYGYSRPKVTDIITIPIYASRMSLNNNGIPQGRTGGEVTRLFRKWKRDQEVLAFRFPDYEVGRTIRVRVVEVGAQEIITEKQTDGISREDYVIQVSFMRDDFAEAYADG